MKPAKPDREDSIRKMDDRSGDTGKQPEWTEGLRQLYDSVVDEPLPDNLKDLLSKLDDSH